MSKKRAVDWLQNISLVVLTILALFLLTRFSVLKGAVSGQMQALLSMPEDGVRSVGDLSGAITSVNIAVTNEIEYGRYTDIGISVASEEFRRMAPLLRDAIGSTTVGEDASDYVFRSALKTPGIYLDLTAAMPLSCAAAWLGTESEDERTVRALALTTEKETATLFLVLVDGTVVRSDCALTSVAVREMTAAFEPNGGRFAFESGYDALSPYTVLVQEIDAPVDMAVSIPGGYNTYNLLTALDFNAHTYSRYVESSGVEVVFQSPHTLRINKDGTVNYSCDGEVESELFRVSSPDGVPTSAEALRTSCAVAAVLTEGTDAAILALDGMEKTENGWIVRFGYCINGVNVRLGGDRTALRIVIEGDRVSSFEYYCRAYMPLEQRAVLLPPSMAVAIASLNENAELTMAYVDNGAEVVSARWFAQ